MRRVAIVADRDGTMAGLEPCVVMILHNVAVRAGFRVVGQVRSTFGINEGEGANTAGDTHRHTDDHPFDRARFHRTREGS